MELRLPKGVAALLGVAPPAAASAALSLGVSGATALARLSDVTPPLDDGAAFAFAAPAEMDPLLAV